MMLRMRVGLFLPPEADRIADLRAAARAADEAGLDCIGIQDHPYQRRFVDTWSLIAVLLADTQRITIFPDVANLPLCPPAVMAKAAASLDVISGGRFELGLGAGAFWEGVEAMGGPRRSPGESVDALEEAIAVIRAMWSSERSARFDGRHYRLSGVKPGPAPAHPIGIWLGAYKPRMLRLVGTHADGWIPSLGYASPPELEAGNARIDEAAAAAGRDPGQIRRLVNVTESADEEMLAGLAAIGFDTAIVSPGDDWPAAIERLASEVLPGVQSL
jgi:alkanesulfonate monooxygenase SsuD/methylene tetrahydromethanopterin reductase-like flavin-dependent oxidoreductase (luciferase family)